MAMQSFEKVPGTVPRGRYSHLSSLWQFYCRFNRNGHLPVLIGYIQASAFKSIMARSLKAMKSSFERWARKIEIVFKTRQKLLYGDVLPYPRNPPTLQCTTQQIQPSTSGNLSLTHIDQEIKLIVRSSKPHALLFSAIIPKID